MLSIGASREQPFLSELMGEAASESMAQDIAAEATLAFPRQLTVPWIELCAANLTEVKPLRGSPPLAWVRT
jgi:hypothetical protein